MYAFRYIDIGPVGAKTFGVVSNLPTATQKLMLHIRTTVKIWKILLKNHQKKFPMEQLKQTIRIQTLLHYCSFCITWLRTGLIFLNEAFTAKKKYGKCKDMNRKIWATYFHKLHKLFPLVKNRGTNYVVDFHHCKVVWKSWKRKILRAMKHWMRIWKILTVHVCSKLLYIIVYFYFMKVVFCISIPRSLLVLK